MKDYIRVLLGANYYFHYLYMIWGVNTIKMKGINVRGRLRKRRIKVHSYNDLLCHSLAIRDKKNKKNVCHIIGSGASLNKTKEVIGENDFIIGNNFAGLCPLDYDLYFVEFGGYDVQEVSEKHLKIVKKNVLKHTDAIYFKNLWEKKNDGEFIVDKWIGYALPIFDYVVPCISKKRLDQTLRFCLKKNSKWMPQFISTVVTGIFVAYHLGFEKIVVHGVDFGGKYFYDSDDFTGDINLRPDYNKIKGLSTDNYSNSRNGSSSPHSTAVSEIGMKSVLGVISDILKEKSIYLYSAGESSESSKLLPVWK